MNDKQECSPDWMEEFRKANAASVCPVPPPPRAGTGRDRRRHPRFEIDEAPAVLLLRKLLPFFRTALSRKALDLSEGGVRILAVERLTPGLRLGVRIDFQKFQDAIQGEAEVRWCRQLPGTPHGFHLGLMFTREDLERARKIASMRGYFTSPTFRAARQKRMSEKDSLFLK